MFCCVHMYTSGLGWDDTRYPGVGIFMAFGEVGMKAYEYLKLSTL
jgi:hypothetical protein